MVTLYRAGLWIGPRAQLEQMPAFRQVIPYVILKVGDRLVRYTRTEAGNEQRLHGRVSIGLGGHIDLADMSIDQDGIDLPNTLQAAAQREVDEELTGIDSRRRQWQGLLVDNDSDVGKVHIGVVACWYLRTPPHGSQEDAIGEIGLATLDQLHQLPQDRLETWSQLVVEWLRTQSTP